MLSYLAVAAGGALGATARYAAGNIRLSEAHPCLTTMAINITGCLLIGIAWAIIDSRQLPVVWYRLAVTGFLGGFTTYSTFSLEAVRLFADGHAVESVMYSLLTVTLCIGACAVSLLLTQHLLK